jgi:SAM-dependent methyltransferase
MIPLEIQYARRYRTLWERHWWWRARERFLVNWIERVRSQTPCRKILDVGCGDGLFFGALQRFGEVHGIEPDRSLVTDPRWAARIEHTPLGPSYHGSASYDIVLMLDVLEHIEDDVGALRSAATALRPGGRLLLTVPALPWLWSRHDVANNHFRRYGRDGLHRVLDSAGFEVETVRYYFFWTIAPLLLRRWLSPETPGSADYEVSIPPRPVNAALTLLSRADHFVSRSLGWPLGTSLFAIARKPMEHLARSDRPNFPGANGCSSRPSAENDLGPCPASPFGNRVAR